MMFLLVVMSNQQDCNVWVLWKTDWFFSCFIQALLSSAFLLWVLLLHQCRDKKGDSVPSFNIALPLVKLLISFSKKLFSEIFRISCFVVLNLFTDVRQYTLVWMCVCLYQIWNQTTCNICSSVLKNVWDATTCSDASDYI